MRILFLTHRLPYPPNKGDKIRSYHILEFLAARHDVVLACPVDEAADLAAVPVLEKRLSRVLTVRVRRWLALPRALLEVLRLRSITVRYFYSSSLQDRVDRFLDGADVDAVLCFSSPMAEYVYRSRHATGKLVRVAKVMDLIDVDSFKWRQYADRSPAWKAWLYRNEARALEEYERRILRNFDQVLLVSDQERSFLPPGGRARISALSNGVDLDFFQPGHRTPIARDRPNIVFTGVMDYWPNVEGMQWFLASVFALIRLAVPEARLFIVGSKPTREVCRWDDGDSIVVTGFVADIRDYLSAADVCVAPLRIARGVQNKVLEAMAMARPVVTTPEAFEGILGRPGEDVLVAGDAETFAKAVIGLLGDRGRAEQLGRNARKLVEKHYGWASNLRPLESLFANEATSVQIPGVG